MSRWGMTTQLMADFFALADERGMSPYDLAIEVLEAWVAERRFKHITKLGKEALPNTPGHNLEILSYLKLRDMIEFSIQLKEKKGE